MFEAYITNTALYPLMGIEVALYEDIMTSGQREEA